MFEKEAEEYAIENEICVVGEEYCVYDRMWLSKRNKGNT